MLLNKPGVSLLELLIAIALLALVMGLSVHSYQFIDRFIVYSHLRHLCMLCTCLRYQAMTLHTPCSLVFDPQQRTYTYGTTRRTLPAGVCVDYLPGVLGPPGSPVAPITRAITFSGNTITFYPDGTVSAGTVYLTDKHKSCLYAFTIAVGEYPYTRMYVYRHKWCVL